MRLQLGLNRRNKLFSVYLVYFFVPRFYELPCRRVNVCSTLQHVAGWMRLFETLWAASV